MMKRNRSRTFVVSLITLLVMLAACKGPKETALIVFAAASLRDAFTAMGEDFKKEHAGLGLTFNFAGTQELRTQLEQGAAVDVFASADQKHMGELLAAKRVTAPTTFARNEPVVVVAKEQAAKLRSFSDLPRAKRIVIGVPDVPIGRYTIQILDNASQRLDSHFRTKVEAAVVSRELNVKQVLAKVTLGEADAGIVYRTDAMTAKDQVAVVPIPVDLNVSAEYPIAVVANAPHPVLASEWVKFVLSSAGQDALKGAGFLATAGAATP
jgi:molybdate transport system substrate-binding protein